MARAPGNWAPAWSNRDRGHISEEKTHKNRWSSPKSRPSAVFGAQPCPVTPISVSGTSADPHDRLVKLILHMIWSDHYYFIFQFAKYRLINVTVISNPMQAYLDIFDSDPGQKNSYQLILSMSRWLVWKPALIKNFGGHCQQPLQDILRAGESRGCPCAWGPKQKMTNDCCFW